MFRFPTIAFHVGAPLVGFVSLTSLFLGGCGSGAPGGKELIKVSGTVSLSGTPLTSGTVVFWPEQEASGNSASSEIDATGKFDLKTSLDRPGVEPGQYLVAVQAYDGPPVLDQLGNEVSRKKAVPDKFFDPKKSALTVTVEPGKPQPDLKLDLKP